MPTEIFYVPVMLCIEADNPAIALNEGLEIAQAVVDHGEGRHLRKDVVVPSMADPLPPKLTLPTEPFFHRGIPG